MPGRVEVDPEVILAVVGIGRAQVENLLFGHIEIIDLHVEVQLLRHELAGPLRRRVRGDELEGDPGPTARRGKGDPVLVVEDPLHPEEFFIKRGEAAGVRAVEDH